MANASSNQPYHTRWSLSIREIWYRLFCYPDMKSMDHVICRIKKKPHSNVKEKSKGNN